MLDFAGMTEAIDQSSAEEPPPFPYHILWPGYGKEIIRFGDLVSNTQEYEIINEYIGGLRSDSPSAHKKSFYQTVSEFELPEPANNIFVHNIWLISCFYLAPRQWKAMEHDEKAIHVLLAEIAMAASKLNDLMGKLPPKVAAAMILMRPAEPDALAENDTKFLDLYTELHDLALVSRRVSNELAPRGGRPAEFVRDTAMRLLLEQLRDFGINDLQVSMGTKSLEPHLKGKAGRFIVKLFKLLDPAFDEISMVPKIKSIRAKLNKAGPGVTEGKKPFTKP